MDKVTILFLKASNMILAVNSVIEEHSSGLKVDGNILLGVYKANSSILEIEESESEGITNENFQEYYLQENPNTKVLEVKKKQLVILEEEVILRLDIKLKSSSGEEKIIFDKDEVITLSVVLYQDGTENIIPMTSDYLVPILDIDAGSSIGSVKFKLINGVGEIDLVISPGNYKLEVTHILKLPELAPLPSSIKTNLTTFYVLLTN